MNAKLKKKFRAIGHQLRPAVTVARKGLSDSVLTEINRALDDHELIKVRILGNRKERAKIVEVFSQFEAAEIIQIIGGIILIYRPSREPNPSLSNVLRANLL